MSYIDNLGLIKLVAQYTTWRSHKTKEFFAEEKKDLPRHLRKYLGRFCISKDDRDNRIIVAHVEHESVAKRLQNLWNQDPTVK